MSKNKTDKAYITETMDKLFDYIYLLLELVHLRVEDVQKMTKDPTIIKAIHESREMELMEAMNPILDGLREVRRIREEMRIKKG